VNLYSHFPKKGHQTMFDATQPSEPLVISGVGNISAKGYVVSDFIEMKKKRNIFFLNNFSHSFP